MILYFSKKKQLVLDIWLYSTQKKLQCWYGSPNLILNLCNVVSEYRCPCPLNACPKNVLIGPATGKAPTGGGPADVPSYHAPPGAPFRPKVRACLLDAASDTHGSGKVNQTAITWEFHTSLTWFCLYCCSYTTLSARLEMFNIVCFSVPIITKVMTFDKYI